MTTIRAMFLSWALLLTPLTSVWAQTPTAGGADETAQQTLVSAESCPQVILILNDGTTLGGRRLLASGDLLRLDGCDGVPRRLAPEEVRDIFAVGPLGTLIPSEAEPAPVIVAAPVPAPAPIPVAAPVPDLAAQVSPLPTPEPAPTEVLHAPPPAAGWEASVLTQAPVPTPTPEPPPTATQEGPPLPDTNTVTTLEGDYESGLKAGMDQATSQGYEDWLGYGAAGGFLCGPCGCLAATLVGALTDPKAPSDSSLFQGQYTPEFWTGYEEAYTKRAKRGRTTMALAGGAIGTLAVGVIVVALSTR